MSGRHRKPSTTGRTVVKAAATGAMLGGASLVLSAPVANAAPVSQWEQVASCESGGNWAINTGNGYHGGLQFSPSTWNSYGGGQYAPTANRASKAQQIAVAEKVLAGQGKGAWPSCGTGLGSATPRTAAVAANTQQAPAPKPAAEPAPIQQAPAPKPAAAPAPIQQAPAPKPAAAPAPVQQAPKVAANGKAQYVQQVISQAQSTGHQLDPALVAMLHQAAAQGY